MQDRALDCAECGQPFVFTEGEQRFYKERGLDSDPRRCPACRNHRKPRTPNAKERRPAHQANRRTEQRMGGCISSKFFAQMSQNRSYRRQINHLQTSPSRGTADARSRNGRQSDSRHNRSKATAGHPITCARCGKQAFVPFTPRNKAVVYCPDCYRMQKRHRR